MKKAVLGLAGLLAFGAVDDTAQSIEDRLAEAQDSSGSPIKQKIDSIFEKQKSIKTYARESLSSKTSVVNGQFVAVYEEGFVSNGRSFGTRIFSINDEIVSVSVFYENVMLSAGKSYGNVNALELLKLPFNPAMEKSSFQPMVKYWYSAPNVSVFANMLAYQTLEAIQEYYRLGAVTLFTIRKLEKVKNDYIKSIGREI